VVCLIFVACSEEIQPLKTLQKGMPNTIILSTGDVVYDLTGEWETINRSSLGKSGTICKITQQGNKFVGISTIQTPFADKGSEVIKGVLEKNGFKSVKINATSWSWMPSVGKIDDGCNKIVVKTREGRGTGAPTGTTTLTRK
ncbi:MAG: hypothetical protein HKO79_04560, partial [Desulfobacterales bacterium]|nr:hypothetical protein [Desulfobacterales bacterium]